MIKTTVRLRGEAVLFWILSILVRVHHFPFFAFAVIQDASAQERFTLCLGIANKGYVHQLASSCTFDTKRLSLGLQHECQGAVSRSGHWGMIELCRL